jgi:PAS domain S-box-containing protein
MNSNSMLTEEQKELTYRTIFKDSSEPKLLIDRDGVILDVNEAFCKRMSKKACDCLGMNIYGMLSPEVATRRKSFADEVFRTGKRMYFDDDRNGHYLRNALYPIFGDNGETKMLYILIQDITQTKLAELKTQKIAAISQEVMEAFPGPFTVLDVNGKIVSCNSHFHKIVATNNDEDLSGINTFDLFHPDDLVHLHIKLANIVKHGAEETADLRILMQGGPEYRWFRISTKRLIIENEIFLVSSGTDIEKYKNKEKQLSLSNEKLSFILSESKTGSWEWNLQTNTNTWSNEIWELYGLDINACETSYEGWKNSIIVEDQNTVEQTVLEASQKGVPFRIEWRSLHTDGSLHWLMSRGIPFRDASGNVSHYVGIVIDITDLKETEQMLKYSEERFRTLFEDHASAILIIDSETFRILNANKAAIKFYGWPSEVLCGKSIREISTKSSEELLDTKRNIRDHKNTHFSSIHRKADGSYVEVEIFCNRSNLSEKSVFFCIVNDVTERNIAQRELLKNKVILDAALESMSDAVFISDLDGRFIEFNDAFATFHRFRDKEECLKTLDEYHNIIEVFMADASPAPLDQWAVPRALRGESGVAVEYGLKRKDTGETWVGCYNFAPIRDQKGDIIGSVVTGRDITHQKQAEKALRESEERFRNFFEQHSAGMMIVDPATGRIVDVNHAASEYYGWSKERLCEMTVMDLNIEDPAISFKRLDAWKTAEKRTFTVTHRKADGSLWDIEVYGKRIYVKERPLAFLILHDITEQKKSQRALVESNERMHFILNATNAGTWESDLATMESKWSDELFRLNGIEPREKPLTHEEVLATFVEEDRLMGEQAAADAISHAAEFNASWRIRDNNGNIKCLLCKGNPVKDANGKVVKYVGITLDITEQKRTEEEKKQLETRIRRSERLETLGNLAGGIAHDFNNMLTPILGYAEMGMLDLPANDKLYTYLNEITKAAERAKNLVYQILTFSKSRETESSSISIQSIIDEALKLLRASIPTTISIEKHIDQNCRNIFADPSKIYQVILNLCTNAFHAMEESGGTLSIGLDETTPGGTLIRKFPELNIEPYVQLTITDTGHGMESRTLDRIFEPFFTTKPINKGTGLGLSVVHGIITSYKGVIDVESQPNKGATFHIYLPISDKRNADKKQQSVAAGRLATILLVDDEEQILKVMSLMLSQFGHTIETASTPGKALEIFSQSPQKFDVVITDLTMPEMTGIRLASEMYKCRPEMPVILMTGYAKEMDFNKMEKNHIVRLLKKPVMFDTMIGTIEEVIARKR